jgi:exopolysaccharide production protein ExoZ
MIANLQVLRALAALLVVFYHLQAPMRSYMGASLHTSFGASGVDIFFVVSGFIMFYTNRRFERTGVTFLKDRIVRIVPLYWLGTGLILAILATGRNPDGVQAVDAGDVIMSMLFIPNVRADGNAAPVLTLGWTLIYEMFFYALFAGLIFLRASRKILVILTVVFSLLIITGQAWSIDNFTLHYFTNPIMLEFLMGGALALWFMGRQQRQAPAAAPVWCWLGLLAGCAAIVATEALKVPFLDKGGLLRPLVFGLPAMLIVACALELERGQRAWRSHWVQLLGAASYALYLFHPVVIQSTCIAVSKALSGGLWTPLKQAPLGAELLITLAAALCLGAAVAVALVVYRWVEIPVTRRLKAALA